MVNGVRGEERREEGELVCGGRKMRGERKSVRKKPRGGGEKQIKNR